MTERAPCLVELMNLGVVLNLLGGLLFCLSLGSPYQATPILYGGPFHSVLPPDATWLSTWDEIRMLPGWWVPILLGLAASWIMSGFVLTRRRRLLEWSVVLGMVAVAGLLVGLCFAGLHLLGLGAAQFLGSGFWASLAAMGLATVGNIVITASATRLADSPKH